MDEFLTMADQTKVEDAYVVDLGDNHIAIYAKNIHSVREAWQIFGDPEKTASMHSYQYGEEADWNGYTEPTAVQVQPDSAAMICLEKVVMDNV